MNNIVKYLNYNFINIIKENRKNNDIKKPKTKSIPKLVIKKELCIIAFILINFLIAYVSQKEMYEATYQNNILMYIIKDNIKVNIIWFIVLNIIPIITCIMTTKNMKSKYYLLLLIIYLISNIYNILLITYYILSFINSKIPGLLGIVNIILTLIVNINIIVKIKEDYLK